MAESTSAAGQGDTPLGFAFAAAAYIFWGFLPFYMKWVAHIPATEVVAHRIVWSLPIAAAVLLATGRFADLRHVFRSPRTLGMAMVTAALLSVNWGLYVWAVGVGRVLDAALGYYINPLITVALGAFLLGERLNRFQLAAMALAGIGVAIMTLAAGGLPLVSIGLALSWALYSLSRKTLPIDSSQGFFLEALLLTLPSLVWIAWVEHSGAGHFGDTGTGDIALLLGLGFVTAVPLLVFAKGAKLLRLSTIGIMQYIAPGLVFLIAVFWFHEPFGLYKAVAFGFIWLSVFLFSYGIFAKSRRGQRPMALANQKEG
ncbi:EamA family transporter RarD [Methylovirgula sp. 4M-Z18]|uniref:EamA family transporter RarD n=1 Tax=Methylovirgula sp. 4M-Z18 TaxID=2293567 RepID=UPI001FDEC686|nr:EamA family transporter RarD [Methylovirgula sp. 4M-Z18]